MVGGGRVLGKNTPQKTSVGKVFKNHSTSYSHSATHRLIIYLTTPLRNTALPSQRPNPNLVPRKHLFLIMCINRKSHLVSYYYSNTYRLNFTCNSPLKYCTTLPNAKKQYGSLSVSLSVDVYLQEVLVYRAVMWWEGGQEEDVGDCKIYMYTCYSSTILRFLKGMYGADCYRKLIHD